MNNSWLDLSLPIHEGMHIWPDNPDVALEREQCLQHGDVCNVSKLQLGTHTGTHIDGLNHFIKGAPGIDQMPLDFNDRNRSGHRNPPTQRKLPPKNLTKHNLQAGERVLFRTNNSEYLLQKESFQKEFVHICRRCGKSCSPPRRFPLSVSITSPLAAMMEMSLQCTKPSWVQAFGVSKDSISKSSASGTYEFLWPTNTPR